MLVPCKECGAKLAQSAKRCPSCGAEPRPVSTSVATIIFYVIAIPALILALLFFLRSAGWL